MAPDPVPTSTTVAPGRWRSHSIAHSTEAHELPLAGQVSHRHSTSALLEQPLVPDQRLRRQRFAEPGEELRPIET
jgi:hypothetical protein